MSTFTLAMNRIMYDREKWGKQSEIERCLPMVLCKGEAGINIFRSRSSGGFPFGKPLQLRHVRTTLFKSKSSIGYQAVVADFAHGLGKTGFSVYSW